MSGLESRLEKVELNRANAFTFLVPIFGLAIGATLFGERLAWIQAAGVVLVLVGTVLVQRDARAGIAEARGRRSFGCAAESQARRIASGRRWCRERRCQKE